MFSPTSSIGEKAGMLQPQRIEHQLLQGRLIGLAGQGLDDAAGHHDRRVVVGQHLAGRRQLRQLLHGGEEAGQRIVAAAEVAVVVAQPARAVVQQLAHGHASGGRLVGERARFGK